MVLNWLFSFKIRRKFVFVNKKRGSWKDSKIFNISFPLELVISRLQTHHITVGKRTTKSGRFEDTLSPSAYLYEKFLPIQYWGCLSILTLSILTFSRMTLLKVSFSNILRYDYLDHFDTFGENFDFYTFKNDTFKNDTFESVGVDRHP